MKKLLTFIFSIFCFQLFGQGLPSNFKYQTSIRDNAGNLIANRLVAFRISILQGGTNGTTVYSETHNTATTDFGIANLNIGGGTPLQGSFNTIDWGNGSMFLKVEIDLANGSNFNFMGTSQLLSVPYALYAAKAGNASDDMDKDSTNELQHLSFANNQLQLNKNGGTINLEKYIDNTDSQTISLQGNTLSISGGNSIVLSGAVDLDSDPTNEIQTLQLKQDSLFLSKGNAVVLPKDNDRDSLNELQILSVSGNKISISKGNQVSIDADTTNELQSLSLSSNQLSLSKGGGSVNVAEYKTVQNSSAIYGTAIGADTIIITTIQNSNFVLIPGTIVNFKVDKNNKGHVRINLNNSGLKNVFYNVLDTLKPNDFSKDKMISVIYDGSNFQTLTHIQPIREIAQYVFDTTTSTCCYYYHYMGGSLNQWLNFAKFNRKVFNTSKSGDIQLINDTIFLKEGVYRINFKTAVVKAVLQGLLPIRLYNLTDSISVFQDTKEQVNNGNYLIDEEIIVKTDRPTKLFFQFLNLRDGTASLEFSAGNQVTKYTKLFDLKIEKL